MPGISAEAKVIFVEEFRRQVRRLSWQILTLLVPIALVISLIVVPIIQNAVEDDTPSAPLDDVGYVDMAGVVLDVDRSGGPFSYPSRAEGIQAILDGDIEALFIVSDDYLETGQVEQYRMDGGFLSDGSLSQAFREFLTVELIAGLVEPDVLERVVEPADFTTYEVASDGTFEEEAPDAQQAGEFFVPFIFAVLLMVAIFSGSGSLLQSVADEKENRMIEMIITSATPLAIMGGKVLALGLAGLVQVTVWVVSAAFLGPLIFDQIPNAGDLSISVGLLAIVLVLFLAGYMLFAVIMAGMGAATTSVREASQISAIITIPSVIPIWFSGVLIAQPDGVFARILSYLPVTAPTTILIRLSAGNVSVAEVAGSIAVIVVTTAALLWVSARVFRAGLLLYGQRMSLKNVWQALKYAD